LVGGEIFLLLWIGGKECFLLLWIGGEECFALFLPLFGGGVYVYMLVPSGSEKVGTSPKLPSHQVWR